jgi:hypothetical protein
MLRFFGVNVKSLPSMVLGRLTSDAMTLAILILYIINQFSIQYESHGITL